MDASIVTRIPLKRKTKQNAQKTDANLFSSMSTNASLTRLGRIGASCNSGGRLALHLWFLFPICSEQHLYFSISLIV